MIPLAIIFLFVAPQTATMRTGEISGVVLDESGVPVERAWLVLTSADLPGARTAISAEDGRFEFANLPAGRFRLYGSKPFYQATEFGQRTPQDLATMIRITAGQQLTDLRLRLPRTASIRGRFVDQSGKAIPFRSWSALHGNPEVKRLNDAGQPQASLYFELDAGGGFKIDRLRAGTYRLQWTAPSPAVEVTVADGQRMVNVLVPAVVEAGPVPKSDIEGDLVGADGNPVRGVDLAVISMNADPPREVFLPHSAKVDDLGHFLIKDVPVGRYLLAATHTIFTEPPSAQTHRTSWASTEVFVADKVRGYARLILQPGVTVRGRVSQSGMATEAPFTKLAINLLPKDSPMAVSSRISPNLSSQISPDGSFAVSSVPPGHYTIALWGYEDMHNLLDDWNLDGAFLDGVDVLDMPFTVSGEDVSALDLRLSERQGMLEGITRNGVGDLVFTGAVIVFATERQAWVRGSTRIRAQRPDTSGAFVFTNLPSGEYFVAAVADIEPGAWLDPKVLSALSNSATRVSIAGSAPVRVALTVR